MKQIIGVDGKDYLYKIMAALEEHGITEYEVDTGRLNDYDVKFDASEDTVQSVLFSANYGEPLGFR